MKTTFDECEESKALENRLLYSRGDSTFFSILQSWDPKVSLHPPITDIQIRDLEEFTNGNLPNDLMAFLKYSNGLTYDNDDEIVFSSGEIIEQTTRMRQADSSFPIDHLLFIGNLGDGDMFAFAKNKDGTWSPDIFWCDHETQSCFACALGIQNYVARHVGWRGSDEEQQPEDIDRRAKENYRENLRRISGEEEVIPGLKRLIRNILEKRATQNPDELAATYALTTFLNYLNESDFQKIPIERFLPD